jgi:hypothetical protein
MSQAPQAQGSFRPSSNAAASGEVASLHRAPIRRAAAGDGPLQLMLGSAIHEVPDPETATDQGAPGEAATPPRCRCPSWCSTTPTCSALAIARSGRRFGQADPGHRLIYDVLGGRQKDQDAALALRRRRS